MDDSARCMQKADAGSTQIAGARSIQEDEDGYTFPPSIAPVEALAVVFGMVFAMGFEMAIVLSTNRHSAIGAVTICAFPLRMIVPFAISKVNVAPLRSSWVMLTNWFLPHAGT